MTNTHLLALPLEVVCSIFEEVASTHGIHAAFYFSLVSRCASRVFKFNLNKIIDIAIAEWGALIFKCPECNLGIRGGAEVTSSVLYYEDGEKLAEKLYRTCRKCRRCVRKNNMKFIYQVLEKVREDRDAPSKSRSEAFQGVCRYNETRRSPTNKDIRFMREVAKKIYCV